MSGKTVVGERREMEMEEVDRVLAGYLETSPALPASKLMQLHQLSTHINASNEGVTVTGVQQGGEEGGEAREEESGEEGEDEGGSESDSGSMSI